MSSQYEEDDDIYQVPLSSLEYDSPAQCPSEPEETAPPVLMPKRGSGFKRNSSLLDRHVVKASPNPPPRNISSNRKASVDDSEIKSGELNIHSVPDHQIISQNISVESLNGTKIPVTNTDEVFTSTSVDKSEARSTTTSTKVLSATSQKSAALSKNVSEVIGTAADQSSVSPISPAPSTRPVPIPRPRTKVLQVASNNSSPHASTSSTSVSLPSAMNRLTEQSSGIEPQSASCKSPASSAVKEDDNLFTASYSFPPDADSIELMLNNEVDKKYGLHLSQNNVPESAEVIPENSNAISTINSKNSGNVAGNDDSNEYISHNNARDISLLQHGDQAVVVQTLPKPHSIIQGQQYLQMTDKGKQGQIITILQSDQPIRPRRSHLSKVVSAICLDPGLLGESSSDDIPVSVDNSVIECDINPTPAQTTPKPFNDIKPFRSNVLQQSDAIENETEQDGRPQSLAMSYFDPLWDYKSKSTQSSNSSLVEKQNFTDFNETNTDFVVDWNNALTELGVSKFSNTVYSAYATADEDIDPSEAYYSQIKNESQEMTTADVWKLQPTRQSFYRDAPLAPPPPLPRQQHRIPEPAPPRVPPRPENASSSLQPLITSKSSPNTATITSSSPTNSDIFQDLPTPIFMQNQACDPFQNSNFDYECLKFNKTQVPVPPSRSPLPKTPMSKVGGSSNEINSSVTSLDPRMDPERISRFVIPPPTSRKKGPSTEEYDLARELSSSDSEGTDISTMDSSMHGWPASGLPLSPPLKVFDGALLPKKTSRDGYLLKQGGYKANKGWKRRWVVFSGTSLSYYNNSTSQVSKRIIPVRCMVSIETDVKDTDKNSFKFKVITSLKDRVFLFSSDTLEDCITWASILMHAITEYKRSFSSGEEVPPSKPDKEGFVKFSNMKKYYVTVTGKTLSYYQTFEDFQMGSPTHEIDMKLCSVKVKDHKKMQLWIHYGHFDLVFDSDQEMQHWRMSMEDAIAEGLADDTVLNKVYENLSNHYCADCNAENPHWASINLGIVVCKSCAGVHRMFDPRVSKIKSLRMDTRVWTPSLVEVMVTIGNASSNAFWEFDLPMGTKIQPTESMDKRKEFITQKYRNRRFCNLHPLANCGPALGEALLNEASNDNVLEMMRILFSGVDVLFRKEERSQTAYDIAKDHGQRLVMELLYQNGGDPQNLEQDVIDENRLREDIRLEGFLNKTGPVGRTFEKRWCVLEHGALTYYINEKSKTFKGSIDRKDMYMVQTVDTDRLCYGFELSTGLKDSRIFAFSSESKDDCGMWIRTIAKLMAPIAVMDHVGATDIKFAGFAYIKESLVDEWRQTFIVFSWRGINYMSKDLKFDYIDLRKASSIKMQDSTSSYQQHGQCFVISSTGKSVYLQATLPRDTEKMYTTFLEASISSGPTLNDQALTNENVPVIVERCITHIHMNGLDEKGIYRTAGQNSKVQSLLDDFRKDAWSVSLSEYTVQDVANVLKRFLRELDDSVFERINYGYWISMAGGQDRHNRLKWYKYYLEKMPLVNYQTLKRIILHLLRVSQSKDVNLMSITNLASCFAPSLLRTAKDEQPDLTSEASSKEISIVADLMNDSDYFFNVNENERVIMNNIQKAEIEIQKRNQDKMKSPVDAPTAGILTPVHFLGKDVQSINILVTVNKTAKEAMDDLKRNKTAPDLGSLILHEQLFQGALGRPFFPEDLVDTTIKRWGEWENWVMKDNNVYLCVQGTEHLEKLQKNFNANHVLLSKLYYCDCKPKSSFKKKMVGFRQCKLAVYNDAHGSSESISWNVEDITIYLGSMHKSPPTRYCLTFTVDGEKYVKPPFGHCLSFDTDDELYRWAAAMYTVQHPGGLSWINK